MAILDKEALNQSGLRWFGDLEAGGLISLKFGNPESSGMQLPNGQTYALLSVEALQQLIQSATRPADPVFAQNAVPSSSATIQYSGGTVQNADPTPPTPENPGLGPTP